MQFQADILDTQIMRAANLETTALGAAFLAGLSVGYWQDLEELKRRISPARVLTLRWGQLNGRTYTRDGRQRSKRPKSLSTPHTTQENRGGQQHGIFSNDASTKY